MGWRVKVADLELDEDEVTVAQAADIARLAGGGWETLDPLLSPGAAAAIVTVMLMSAGSPEVEAMVEVNAMRALDLLAAIVKG